MYTPTILILALFSTTSAALSTSHVSRPQELPEPSAGTAVLPGSSRESFGSPRPLDRHHFSPIISDAIVKKSIDQPSYNLRHPPQVISDAITKRSLITRPSHQPSYTTHYVVWKRSKTLPLMNVDPLIHDVHVGIGKRSTPPQTDYRGPVEHFSAFKGIGRRSRTLSRLRNDAAGDVERLSPEA